MTLRRYLLYFAYNGSCFRSLQLHLTKQSQNREDPSSVQGIIEYMLRCMHPVNIPMLYLSTRVRGGVHAIRTAACVDMQFVHRVNERYIHSHLNKHFYRNKIDIRILSVQQVNASFNPFHMALWKTYVYKLAIVKTNADTNLIQHIDKKPNVRYEYVNFDKAMNLIPKKPTNYYLAPIPATELKMRHFVCNPKFNVDNVREAMKLFVNNKSASNFLFDKFDGDSVDEPIYYLEIHKEIMPELPVYDCYDYYNITCTTKTRFEHQRLIPVLLAVAQNRLTVNDLKEVIEHSSLHEWSVPDDAYIPNTALYVQDVVYHPMDLEFNIPKPEKTLEEKKQDIKNRISELLERKEKRVSAMQMM